MFNYKKSYKLLVEEGQGADYKFEKGENFVKVIVTPGKNQKQKTMSIENVMYRIVNKLGREFFGKYKIDVKRRREYKEEGEEVDAEHNEVFTITVSASGGASSIKTKIKEHEDLKRRFVGGDTVKYANNQIKKFGEQLKIAVKDEEDLVNKIYSELEKATENI